MLFFIKVTPSIPPQNTLAEYSCCRINLKRKHREGTQRIFCEAQCVCKRGEKKVASVLTNLNSEFAKTQHSTLTRCDLKPQRIYQTATYTAISRFFFECERPTDANIASHPAPSTQFRRVDHSSNGWETGCVFAFPISMSHTHVNDSRDFYIK